MTGPHPTRDDLLMDLIKTNRETEGETITKKQYEKHGEYNPWQAVNRFNSWHNAKASAGVYKENTDEKRITNKELLKDIKKVNDKVEGQIQVHHYRKHGKHSVTTIYNRFNSFPTARGKAYNI